MQVSSSREARERERHLAEMHGMGWMKTKCRQRHGTGGRTSRNNKK